MSTDTNQADKTLVERLFAVGAHFGFTKSRRHPTVRPYIYNTVNGTDIFDLTKTATLITDAKAALHELGAAGKTLLIVGTKDEASELVRSHATEHGVPYVTNRWIGGMITNFSEIKKRIARMHQLIEERESGELERKYTKRERVMIGREVDKLEFNFGGIATLERAPDMLLIVDPRHDAIALQEANDAGIPVVAIMSSDNDADRVAHPVIVNDALQASLALALEELVGAYVAGRDTRGNGRTATAEKENAAA